MKIKRVISILMVLLLSFSGAVYAAESVTKEYNLTTKNKDYAKLAVSDLEEGDLSEARKEIRIDGRKYRAIKVEFRENKQKKPVKRTRTYTGLSEKKVPKTIRLKSGKKLQLSDVKWTENKRNAATGTMTFTGMNQRPNAPATKDITATLPDGSTITVTGHLQRVEQSGSSYDKPFTVKARFIGDRDVSYYQFGDIRIPNNPDSPEFEGYQEVLLSHLGYDPENYRITSGRWTGDYQKENGRTVRYAEFSGQQRSANWTAYYTETVTADSPQLATYDATAEYSNGIEETSYELTAIVTYEKVGLTLLQKILIAGAAVIIIAGLIAVILMIIRKKRDQEASAEA